MATSRSAPIFEIYTDKKGEFRWRARAMNGNLLAAASEGYKAKRDAVHCAKLFGYDPTVAPPAPKAAAVKPAPAKKAAVKAKAPATEATPPAMAAPPTKPKRAAKAKTPADSPAPSPASPPAEG